MATYRQIFERERGNLNRASQKSYEWFEQQSRLLMFQQVGPSVLLRNNDLKNKTATSLIPGEMYFFRYYPKYAATLPVWDMYPLVFPFRIVTGGFIGLNFHYLDFVTRIYLLDQLMDFRTNTAYPEKIRLKLNWRTISRLSKYSGVEQTVHRYLGSHITSTIKKIDPINWTTALMLPLANMVSGANQNG